MDNKASALDPKLKETYDRIMGTAVNPSAPPSAMAQPAVAAAPPQAAAQTIRPAFAPAQPSQPLQPLARVSPEKQTTGKMLPIVFVVVAVIFFIAYAIFWVKLFNVKLPFLPF